MAEVGKLDGARAYEGPAEVRTLALKRRRRRPLENVGWFAH